MTDISEHPSPEGPSSPHASSGHGADEHPSDEHAAFWDRRRQRRQDWPDEWWDEIPVRERSGTPYALIVLALIVLGFVWLGWQGWTWFSEQLDPPGDPGDAVAVTLGDGDTASNIAPELEELGVIPNADVYRWYVRLQGGPAFQAGEYEFRENSAIEDVLDTLAAGPVRVERAVTYPVAIPEGYTVDQIVAAVDESNAPYSGAEFAAVLDDPALLDSNRRPIWLPRPLPEGARQPLEGLLFPATYEVQASESPGLLVDRMLRQFDSVATQVELGAAEDKIGLSPYEALIVASMVEEEAKVDEDRPKIARVILNRLEQGWTLGIDATVVYATGTSELTAVELDSDSPYNTRKFTGLPPTPIASPGQASLEATLEPAEGDWMYYVLTEDDGTHTFAVTEAEFLEAKAICEEKGFCG